MYGSSCHPVELQAIHDTWRNLKRYLRLILDSSSFFYCRSFRITFQSLNYFSWATITSYNKPDSLKQQEFIISCFQKLAGQDQGVGQAMLPQDSREGFFQHLVVIGGTWHCLACSCIIPVSAFNFTQTFLSTCLLFFFLYPTFLVVHQSFE